MFQITSLPVEIFDFVLSCLDSQKSRKARRTLATCLLVSHDFLQLARPYVHRELSLALNEAPAVAKWMNDDVACHIRHLDLWEFPATKSSGDPEVTEDGLDAMRYCLGHKFATLEKLTLSKTTWTMLPRELQQIMYSLMQVPTFRHFGAQLAFDLPVTFVTSSKTLRNLDLYKVTLAPGEEDPVLSSDIDLSGTLETLWLDPWGDEQDTANRLLDVLLRPSLAYTRLRHISIFKHAETNLQKRILELISRSSQSLQCLKLKIDDENCDESLDHPLANMALNLQHHIALESIVIHDCVFGDDAVEWFSDVLNSLPSSNVLKKITISLDSMIHDNVPCSASPWKQLDSALMRLRECSLEQVAFPQGDGFQRTIERKLPRIRAAGGLQFPYDLTRQAGRSLFIRKGYRCT